MALAFNITCPELSQRAIRSEYVCNESSQHQYSCLFDEHKQKYVELCSHPDFVRRGKYFVIFYKGKKVQPVTSTITCLCIYLLLFCRLICNIADWFVFFFIEICYNGLKSYTFYYQSLKYKPLRPQKVKMTMQNTCFASVICFLDLIQNCQNKCKIWIKSGLPIICSTGQKLELSPLVSDTTSCDVDCLNIHMLKSKFLFAVKNSLFYIYLY